MDRGVVKLSLVYRGMVRSSVVRWRDVRHVHCHAVCVDISDCGRCCAYRNRCPTMEQIKKRANACLFIDNDMIEGGDSLFELPEINERFYNDRMEYAQFERGKAQLFIW